MTRSNIDRVQQLSDWLSRTDIARLELRGPGASIRLQRDGCRIVEVPDDPADGPGRATGAASGIAATAGSVGVFLHRHPLRGTSLADPGDPVRRGQVVGLLQIGSLLLPVTSPCDGVVAGFLVQHGTTAGYGDRLVELHPVPAAS